MKQSGMAMVEALVAASLLTLGLLGASRLTLRALDAAQQTRHLEQAQALARETLDCAVGRVQPCPAAESLNLQGMAYSIRLEQLPITPHLTEIAVQVEWRNASRPEVRQWRTRVSTLPDGLGVSSP